MARVTKIGLWLIPWFPALVVAVLIYASSHPTYQNSMFLQLNTDGTTTITHSSPPPLEFHLTWTSGIAWLCVLAFITGILLLVVTAFRSVLGRRSSQT